MKNKPDIAVSMPEEAWHCVLQELTKEIARLASRDGRADRGRREQLVAIHKSISRRVSCQSDTPMVHITYGTT